MDLLEELLECGIISAEHKKLLTNVGENLAELDFAIDAGIINETEFYLFLSVKYKIDFLDINQIIFDGLFTLNAKNIGANFLIIEHKDGQLKIAISDPGDLLLKDKLIKKFNTNDIKFCIMSKNQIKNFYKNFKQSDIEIINKTNKIFKDAINRRVSDIHFDPAEKLVYVKFRIAGRLHDYGAIFLDDWSKIKRRIKILADLDITEQRLPQSGYGSVTMPSKIVHMRISTHPGIFGEALTVRLQDFEAQFLKLSQIGFSKSTQKILLNNIASPNGLFIIAGPTGSGKTTTLYSLLHEIQGRNIMTLEDPVELRISGIKQLDVKEENLISFADGIKSILRHDPDVILVGEIRDPDVAKMALRAALTGKLVLTTVHAFDAIGAISRLIELGLTFEEILRNTGVIVSQRLLESTKQELHRFPISEILPIKTLRSDKKISNLHELEAAFPKEERLIFKALEALHKHQVTNDSFLNIFGTSEQT